MGERDSEAVHRPLLIDTRDRERERGGAPPPLPVDVRATVQPDASLYGLFLV
jgi:hypothetical protein